jgi:hypothetical protein
MIENDITVTLTEVEHEMINDVLNHALESFHLATEGGIWDLPLDNPIIQRYTLIDNLKERFNILWADRFEPFSES